MSDIDQLHVSFLEGANYTEYLGLVFPAKRSTAWEISGKSNIMDIPGICRATASAVGRKFPNKFKNPKTSRHIPISPHLIVTRIIPEKKQNVPRKRSLLFVNDERVEKFNKENDFAPGK